MTETQYNNATPIVGQLKTKRANLQNLKDLIDHNANIQVRFGGDKALNLPAQSLRGQAQALKNQLEQEIASLESQLAAL